MDEARAERYRFGSFEVDVAAGELRRHGLRVRLHPQPFQVLCLLLQRPGEVLSREEISRELWPDGTFVDFEHGVNAAVNRLREALRDRASGARYIETLPRRGYRFIGDVQVVGAGRLPAQEKVARSGNDKKAEWAPESTEDEEHAPAVGQERTARQPSGGKLWLSSAEDLPRVAPELSRGLFLALQAMYLAFYVGALSNLGEIRDLLQPGTFNGAVFWLVSASAGVLIPVRIAMVCAAVLRPPAVSTRYLRLWPFLLGVDLLWAMGPFLLMNHISFGLALACICPLVYAPFAQRSLVLMGAMGTAISPSTPLTSVDQDRPSYMSRS